MRFLVNILEMEGKISEQERAQLEEKIEERENIFRDYMDKLREDLRDQVQEEKDRMIELQDKIKEEATSD